MVHTIVEFARRKMAQTVRAEYVPTKKNKPCLDFWLKSGFEVGSDQRTFVWQAERQFPAPEFIKVVREDGLS